MIAVKIILGLMALYCFVGMFVNFGNRDKYAWGMMIIIILQLFQIL